MTMARRGQELAIGPVVKTVAIIIAAYTVSIAFTTTFEEGVAGTTDLQGISKERSAIDAIMDTLEETGGEAGGALALIEKRNKHYFPSTSSVCIAELELSSTQLPHERQFPVIYPSWENNIDVVWKDEYYHLHYFKIDNRGDSGYDIGDIIVADQDIDVFPDREISSNHFRVIGDKYNYLHIIGKVMGGAPGDPMPERMYYSRIDISDPTNLVDPQDDLDVIELTAAQECAATGCTHSKIDFGTTSWKLEDAILDSNNNLHIFVNGPGGNDKYTYIKIDNGQAYANGDYPFTVAMQAEMTLETSYTQRVMVLDPSDNPVLLFGKPLSENIAYVRPDPGWQTGDSELIPIPNLEGMTHLDATYDSSGDLQVAFVGNPPGGSSQPFVYHCNPDLTTKTCTKLSIISDQSSSDRAIIAMITATDDDLALVTKEGTTGNFRIVYRKLDGDGNLLAGPNEVQAPMASTHDIFYVETDYTGKYHLSWHDESSVYYRRACDPPIIEITAPAPNEMFFTNPGVDTVDITVGGSVTSENPQLTIEVSSCDASAPTECTNPAQRHSYASQVLDASGAFTQGSVTLKRETEILKDNLILVSVTDSQWMSAFKSITVTAADPSDPLQIIITTPDPLDLAAHRTYDETMTVEGRIAHFHGLASGNPRLEFCGPVSACTGEHYLALTPGGTFSYLANLELDATLNESDNFVRVEVTDDQGNFEETEVTLTRLRDTPPTITITTPPDGFIEWDEKLGRLAGNITDDRTHYTDIAATYKVCPSPCVDVPFPKLFAPHGNFNVINTIQLQPGDNTITLSATDTCDIPPDCPPPHTTTSPSITVRRQTASEITIDSPTPDASIGFYKTFEDNLGVTVTYTLGTEPMSEAKIKACNPFDRDLCHFETDISTGTNTYSIPMNKGDGADGLPTYGPILINLTITDNDGNDLSKSIIVIRPSIIIDDSGDQDGDGELVEEVNILLTKLTYAGGTILRSQLDIDGNRVWNYRNPDIYFSQIRSLTAQPFDYFPWTGGPQLIPPSDGTIDLFNVRGESRPEAMDIDQDGTKEIYSDSCYRHPDRIDIDGDGNAEFVDNGWCGCYFVLNTELAIDEGEDTPPDIGPIPGP